MPRVRSFLKKSRADQRLLLLAAALYPAVAAAVHLLPFRAVRRALKSIAGLGPCRRPTDGADARIAQAVRTVAALWPAESCLTEALVAQCLLARYGYETTLCFGVSRTRPDGRPFDAHAWIEHDGARLVGARATVYDPLERRSRCAS